ncbi:hypothetical protein QYE76_041679 [Lolium multiflorum]|uniref:CCHC-type domain-containing protein n=1 Tax=Lolium multiflorum TaxID=4521 RepID=A0AAD8TFV5_LOLMU|nr:hypothetical protein QYE76_041679 [Lolium multiflorum]
MVATSRCTAGTGVSGTAAASGDMASSINFNQFLEKEKLKSNGSNFTDWFRHNMNKEFPELFGMLKAAEIEIKKEHQVLMVNKTTSFKKQGKSKGKFKKGGKKAATPPMKPKNGPKPDAECYYCKEKGHWKRNCSKYLADLKSGLVKKKKEAKLRISPPPPTPRRRAVGFKRSYYFRCPPEGEVDVVFINNRTCDRVRRCCPFVAPEPIVIKIFYALCKRQVNVYRSNNKSLLL